jgi:hypothetical protein
MVKGTNATAVMAFRLGSRIARTTEELVKENGKWRAMRVSVG